MFAKLQRLVLGVEIKRENFTFKQLPEIIGIVFITLLILLFTPFLEIVDRIIVLANEDGLKQLALTSFKTAFITTPIQLVIISLFSEIKDPLKKYGLAFASLLSGFLVVFVMLDLLNDPSMENISGFFQLILGSFPIISAIIVRVCIKRNLRS
jgi:hypothetical protein